MFGKLLKGLAGGKPTEPPSAPAPSPNPATTEADRLIAAGNAAEQAGNVAQACEHYRAAIQAAPRYARAHLNLGIGLEALGEADQAIAAYEATLAIDPAHAPACYNLGRLLFLRDALDRAEPLLRQALASNPGFVDARVVLARLLEQKNDLAAAVAELESALRARPDHLGMLHNQADLLVRLGRLEDAEAALRRAVGAAPDDFDANYRLACLLAQAQKPAEAEEFFDEALRCNPDSFEARVMLADLLLSHGQLEAAAEQTEAALKLRPDSTHLLFNQGLVLKRMARNADAEAAFRRILELDPTYVRAWLMLGAMLVSRSRVREALEVFAEGRRHCPDAFELESPELFALNCLADIPPDELFRRHADFGRRLEQAEVAFGAHANLPDPFRRLRIGFLSADLQYHVVAFFLIPLLEHRDRSAVEVVCYSAGDTADRHTATLRSLSDLWRPVARMPAHEVAELIHRDRVDILVDLAGHSGVPNLRVFAQQPAPVQVSWLGYLNTTGLTRIQYRITDARCDPPGLTDRLHTEKLVRLPHAQWCYRPLEDVPVQPEPPLVRNGHVTFGSFNQTAKISPLVRRLWGEILVRLPGARLLVMGVMDPRAQEDLHADLERMGVDRGRVEMAPFMAPAQYLEVLGTVDIGLDTTPFSGGTTTLDALWMGVPVVTLPGVRSWSRSAASILAVAGLQDWTAQSEEDYVRLAVGFAGQPERLRALRTSLRATLSASPLMDTTMFARDMETAWRDMWRAWCARVDAAVWQDDA
jgi:predicted O-linked N-acetylglucosamine transferase (SPINDLY family)